MVAVMYCTALYRMVAVMYCTALYRMVAVMYCIVSYWYCSEMKCTASLCFVAYVAVRVCNNSSFSEGFSSHNHHNNKPSEGGTFTLTIRLGFCKVRKCTVLYCDVSLRFVEWQ